MNFSGTSVLRSGSRNTKTRGLQTLQLPKMAVSEVAGRTCVFQHMTDELRV